MAHSILPSPIHRTLIVFWHGVDDSKTINSKIQRYKNIIDQQRFLELKSTEFFLLVTCPRIPSHMLQSPEIQKFATKAFLAEVGKMLDIERRNQLFAEGNANIEAWIVSKVMKIDNVFGYSKGFRRLLDAMDILKGIWRRCLFRKKSSL